MMYAKFQDNRTSSSGQKNFERGVPYMDAVAILVM